MSVPRYLPLLFGLPAVAIVLFAAKRTSLEMRGPGWVLAAIASIAPFQTLLIWRTNHAAGIAYAVLCYSAAIGLALRLADHRLSYAWHWPLIIALGLTTLAALAAFPLVTWPAIRSVHPNAYMAESSDDNMRDSLKHLDAALREMQAEQEHLRTVTDKILVDIAARAARLEKINADRTKLVEEIRKTEEARAKVKEDPPQSLAKTTWLDNAISFLIGIASSVTTALAWRFIEPAKPSERVF